jgi:hypothetical protein
MLMILYLIKLRHNSDNFKFFRGVLSDLYRTLFRSYFFELFFRKGEGMTRWLYQVTCWALWFLITDETGWKLGTDLIKAIWKSHYFKHVFSYVTVKMLWKYYAKRNHIKSSHKNMCSIITYHVLIWNLKAKQCTDIFGVLLWLFLKMCVKYFNLV